MKKSHQVKFEGWTTGNLPVWILVLVTWVAYFNAWPDALAMDDASFAVGDRFAYLTAPEYIRFFTEDLWAASGVDSGLYRPLLLASIALDAALFGDWVPGYHLVNILLHLTVTLLVFGLCRQCLREFDIKPATGIQAAFVAALVFAVHPVHTEAVNSVFNRSEMLVGIGIIGGLWWFLNTRRSYEGKAWAGLALVYFLVLLCKESAVTLPAIAVAMIWFTDRGPAREILRHSLPALWLLLPLALFLVLRSNALGDPGFSSPWEIGDHAGSQGVVTFDFARLPHVVVIWFESLRMMVWPHPLKIFHAMPESTFWQAALIQLTLAGLALVAWARGRVGLAAGLSFFYIALLPASRIVAEAGVEPHVAERYLYLPSVGLSLFLALELPWLIRWIGRRPVQIMSVAVLAIFFSLTWSRNQDWSSAVELAEHDYARDRFSGRIVETLVEALLAEGSYGRVIEVCEQRSADLDKQWFLNNSCGIAYYQAGLLSDAEQAFTRATLGRNEASARFNLAGMYLKAGRRNAATEQFEAAIALEQKKFLRRYRQADMLIQLYPTGRSQLLEAKKHLEAAVELQPQFFQARRKLQELNRLLGLGPERSHQD